MARDLASKVNVNPPAGDFLDGSIRDDTGAGDGTPVSEQVYGDFHQFFALLMRQVGVVPNGSPDNSVNNQLMESFFETIERRSVLNGFYPSPTSKIYTIFVDIGDWDMDTDSSVTVAIPVLNSSFEIISASCIVRTDFNAGIGTITTYSDIQTDDGGEFDLQYNSGSDAFDAFLTRAAAGKFDNINYSSTSYNRGVIKIEYRS